MSKSVAINTGGGDAPGLNAAIRAATLSSIKRGWEVYGIQNGFGSIYSDKPFIRLEEEDVEGITLQGGTILGTANRGNPFDMPYTREDGTTGTRDVSDHLMQTFEDYGIDALISIGGDGSMQIAHKLVKKGLNVIGIPKTIDNDIFGCEVTIGFDTAVNTATEAIDKITTTARAHRRIMVVEVMGRYAGWIAMHSGISASADVILIPEIPFSYDPIVDTIRRRERQGDRYSIVVVAEGASPEGKGVFTKGKESGQEVQLGGIGEHLSRELSEKTGKESRSLVLGHLQRGGSPTTYDRLMSLRYGAAAARCLNDEDYNNIIVMQDNKLKRIPISKVAGKMKNVPLDSDTVQTARDIGICMGDE